MQATAKLAAYVGFSVRARRIVYGYDNVLRSSAVRLVVVAEGVNRTAMSRLTKYSESRGVPMVVTDAALIEQCVHCRCLCIGLTDASLAEAAHREFIRMRSE